MSTIESTDTVDAGPFCQWLAETRAALQGEGGTNVPCGNCVGCCVSSYFIPIRPEDVAARAAIPPELLVAAPKQPPGHSMMGYRGDGTCPMLNAGKCSIYAHRPQTCRDYDCRVFAAAGIDAGPDKDVINKRVRAWRFSYASDRDRRTHAAVLAASTFIREKGSKFPGGRAPTAPTGIAVLAIKAYGVFLDGASRSKDDAELANAVVLASREFDRGVRMNGG